VTLKANPTGTGLCEESKDLKVSHDAYANAFC